MKTPASRRLTRRWTNGINLLDTGDFYGSGHNEALVGRAIKGRRRDQIVLSVKFGGLRSPDGGWTGIDARPQALKNFVGAPQIRPARLGAQLSPSPRYTI